MKQMTDEQKEIFKEILSHFISAHNLLLEHSTEWIKEFETSYKKGEQLFKEHFPDRPVSEIEYVFANCRNLWSNLTHQPYMTTFTGRRDVWKAFLSN